MVIGWIKPKIGPQDHPPGFNTLNIFIAKQVQDFFLQAGNGLAGRANGEYPSRGCMMTSLARLKGE